jgi:hypothetical protein
MGSLAAGLLLLAALAVPVSARAQAPAPPTAEASAEAAADAAEELKALHQAPPDKLETGEGWLEDRKAVVEESLGDLVTAFDLFFDKNRKLDLEAPSTRFRVKTSVTTAGDRAFAMGFAVGTSVVLPRLEHWFGNARLVIVGERAQAGVLTPRTGSGASVGDALPGFSSPESDAAAAELTRGRGRAEVRFSVVRQGPLVFDSGTGITLAWPPVPFANLRAHLRLPLQGSFMLRATDVLFIELGGKGPGTSLDLELERFLGADIRLSWEAHGLYAEKTRGIEWSAALGAEWKARPRTGLFTGVGANGFGTPSPGLDVWRTWVGVRQDVWGGWIFAGLEPGYSWPRPAGTAREAVWSVTVRLELVIEGRGT